MRNLSWGLSFFLLFFLLTACKNLPVEPEPSPSSRNPQLEIDATVTKTPSIGRATHTPIPLELAAELPSDDVAACLDGYFAARYQSFYTLKLADFSPFVAETESGRAFWAAEREKLTLEIEHARLYNLRYLQYDFFLTNQVVNQEAERAEIFLLEGHDVIFAASAPWRSSLRNLAHHIRLVKINGAWKVESDVYEDYLWRWLRTVGLPAETLRNDLGEIRNALETAPVFFSVQPVYNRAGAKAYAHRWATAPRPYNRTYADFTELGGDCTNFVSQALFEGGEIPMVFGGKHGIGTAGWYYYGVNDRAAAWTWVDGLYDFLLRTQNSLPLDSKKTESSVLVGDILQFNWGKDTLWNHSVLIVERLDSEEDAPLYLVAGHSPDVDDYPYTAMVYGNAFRFIRIISD